MEEGFISRERGSGLEALDNREALVEELLVEEELEGLY